MTTTRADIATALGAVLNVVASVSRPPVVGPGTAWPEWVANRPQTMGCEVCEVNWNVWLVLPGDPVSAIEAGDTFARDVGAILNKVGAVVTYGPAQLTGDDANAIPALRYELRTS